MATDFPQRFSARSVRDLLVLACSCSQRKIMKAEEAQQAWRAAVKRAEEEEKRGITQWCRYYFSSQGCQRAHFCTFAHSRESFGKIYEDRGGFANSHKIVLCKFYARGQTCSPDCEFAHGAVEMGSVKRGNVAEPKSHCDAVQAHHRPADAKTREIARADDEEWQAVPMEDGAWQWQWQGRGRWQNEGAAAPAAKKAAAPVAAQPPAPCS